MAERSDIQRERARRLRVAGGAGDVGEAAAKPDAPPENPTPPPAAEPPPVEIQIEVEVESVEVPIEVHAEPDPEPEPKPEEIPAAIEPEPQPEPEQPPSRPRRRPPPPPPPPPRARRSLGPAGFIAGLGAGLSRGLDLPAAIELAAGALPSPASGTAHLVARRLRGEYSQDPWGYDEEFVELVGPFFEFMYERWWRVKAIGVENVPAEGPAMIVANHAGVVPWDATMMGVAIAGHHPHPRPPRFMVLDWAFQLPWVSAFMRRVGGVAASPYNAIRLLGEGNLVMVFPEGVKGAGKPFSERYRLQRFGRGGFVEIALRAGVPIVPVAVVGSEEIYPKLGESRLLARLLGAPYFPITPTFPAFGALGAVPLPSKWRIEFCPAIDISGYGPEAAEDRMAVFELSERVRETIQERLLDNLVKRGSAFF
jgi:1-acyl-sn-glycerol-3-phosphate acyltransferase